MAGNYADDAQVRLAAFRLHATRPRARTQSAILSHRARPRVERSNRRRGDAVAVGPRADRRIHDGRASRNAPPVDRDARNRASRATAAPLPHPRWRRITAPAGRGPETTDTRSHGARISRRRRLRAPSNALERRLTFPISLFPTRARILRVTVHPPRVIDHRVRSRRSVASWTRRCALRMRARSLMG